MSSQGIAYENSNKVDNVDASEILATFIEGLVRISKYAFDLGGGNDLPISGHV